jgi:hypothetical protein
LNRRRAPDVQFTDAEPKERAMLAEIFLIRLEAQSRVIRANGSTTQSSDTRFVPITLPKR